MVFNRSPIEMEYEKTYIPMIIERKKHYVGLKYEMNSTDWKIDYKGIAVKRRNYCPLVKEIFWSIIYPALGLEKLDGKLVKIDCNGGEMAMMILKNRLANLQYENMEKFAISASCKSKYKNENLPHIQLVKRMQKRDPGSAPQSGQRFQYVILHSDTTSELTEKSEELSYAIEHNLIPDYIFYLTHQLYNPISGFMALLGQEEATNLLFHEKEKELIEDLRKHRQQLEIECKRNFFIPKQSQMKPLVRLPKAKKISKKRNKTTIESTIQKKQRTLTDYFSKN